MTQEQHEFLLESYKGWLESLNRSEEIGEKRIEFFLTFATAVLGAVFALMGASLTNESRAPISPAFAKTLVRWSVLGLFPLGLVTMLRIVRRNRMTDECKANMTAIRDVYLAGAALPAALSVRHRSRSLLDGGLAVMMLVMNAMLCGIAVAAWLEGTPAVPAGLVSALLGFFVLLAMMRGLERRVGKSG